MSFPKHYASFLLLSALLALGACRKENGIDNNKVVVTPYGVFFADRLGGLMNTNDGLTYHTFPGTGVDGVADRAISISGNNILFIKKNLFISTDNGIAFNYKLNTVNPNAKWASMLTDVPSYGRIYLASTQGYGLEYSEDNGLTWQPDNAFYVPSGGTPPTSGGISSITMVDGPVPTLWALDNAGPRFYIRTSINAKWIEISPTSAFPPGAFYMSSFNSSPIAADYNGSGVYYFDTTQGTGWKKYSGIPAGKQQEIFACSAPFGQTLLVGTDSTGIYRLTGGVLVPSNSGLKSFTSVYGITGKQDIYKNGLIKRYVYIATSTGLYRSEDFGQNWVLMYPGDLRTIW